MEETIKKIVQERIYRKTGELVDEKYLFGPLMAKWGLDSLDAMEIIMQGENEFGVTIPDEAIEKVRNVEDIVNLFNNGK